MTRPMSFPPAARNDIGRDMGAGRRGCPHLKQLERRDFMAEEYFMPLCNKEAKLFREAISKRGYSLESLAEAIWNRHYSDGKTKWLPRPKSLYALLTTGWMSGRIVLPGELVSHIEAETGVSLSEMVSSTE